MTEIQCIVERLRAWYANGEKGMQTLCSIRETPEHVKYEATRWYTRGYARFDAILKDLEKLDDARNR